MTNTRKSPVNKRRLPTSYNNNKKKKSKKTSHSTPPSQAPAAAPSSTALTKDDRIARSIILDPIIERILKNEEEGGKKYGSLQDIVDKSKHLLPWLTANLLKKRVQRRRASDKKKLQEEMAVQLVVPAPNSDHSSIVDGNILQYPDDIAAATNLISFSQSSTTSSITNSDSCSHSSDDNTKKYCSFPLLPSIILINHLYHHRQ